jgi:hypothetical protein
MKKLLSVLFICVVTLFIVSGCGDFGSSTNQDIDNTFAIGDRLAKNQPTPTDIDYSLERYNLIRRAYWVNGQREKARSLPCQITKPLGYVVLLTDMGAVVGRFVVDGKVSSLNSWLTPDFVDESIGNGGVKTNEMPDVDGTYGTNDDGIFFFTTDGKYIEWTGTYLYSDIPFTIENPIVNIEGE